MRSAADPTVVDMRLPIVLLILAATAIPIEWRRPALDIMERGVDVVDAIENIVGYLPLGVATATLGMARAIVFSGLLSLGAESAQLVMAHRHPSLVDVVSNTLGAGLGAFVAHRYRLQPHLRVKPSVAAAALAGVAVVSLLLWAHRGIVPSERGLTAPGRLEGYWRLDPTTGGTAPDASGNGLAGYVHAHPSNRSGPATLTFGGDGDYIDLGHRSALVLVGSMTVSARIRASVDPPDDAAIVSSHNGLGFQLDTTVDTGPRTIGFKLGNSCKGLMARYGATPLVTGRWYDVAGVYNAQAGTLDVYLDGRPDNGSLIGPVTSMQAGSRENVYIGRRADSSGFGFRGDIRDVRIYSYPLTHQQIVADIYRRPGGATVDIQQGLEETPVWTTKGALDRAEDCHLDTDPADAKLPAAAAALGMLAGTACVCFFRTRAGVACASAGLGAGVLIMAIASPTVTSPVRWLLGVICLGACATIAHCVHRPD